MFAGDFALAVHIDGARLVFDRIRLATPRLAFEGVLGAEVNDFGADLVCRFCKITRSARVYGFGPLRILLGFIDLQHGAIVNARRAHISDDSAHRFAVGNVESGMSQRGNFMLARQPCSEMSAHQSRRAGN